MVSQIDHCDPVESYLRPIRSVLFVDDQFPTFADGPDATFREADRARALWRACREQGWLCDVDNSSDWTSDQRKQRLSACDLLVLDYHLVGNDSGPALLIIQGLARSEAPNLVVVYTADDGLDNVLIFTALAARGASAFNTEIAPELEELKFEWTKGDLLSFISGGRDWMRTYSAVCRANGLSVDPAQGEAILEQWVSKKYGAIQRDQVLAVQAIECSTSRWFQCGNLFLAVIGKPADQIPEQETDTLLDGLKNALNNWAPPWLACLIASSRRHIEKGSFRDDIVLPPAPLQAGLLRYVHASEDADEGRRRAREISSHLLARRFEYAEDLMSEELVRRADAGSHNLIDPAENRAQLLHLNAFLCSEPFSRNHLRIGTIVREMDTKAYWACVTPACDMVPREPKKSINPWAAALYPIRPLLALKLEVRRGQGISDALQKAERGRHVFFWDSELNADMPIVAACFNTITDDTNPRLEQMFAPERAKISNKRVTLQRCVLAAERGRVAIEDVACIVVCQLRAPYAERLTHIVGAHLSRIGVNFLQETPETSGD